MVHWEARDRAYLVAFAMWIVGWESLVFVAVLGRREESFSLAVTVLTLFLAWSAMGALALLIARDEQANLAAAGGAAQPPNAVRVLVAASFRWICMLLGLSVPAAIRALRS